ncbi:hypothetical protein MAPG_10518 [Magnaporthiopsis poae ATCC 64411]|uniref:Alpha/beta hydrolase fold-3 domain-containing protein n=1 Tax=Magnaporthiopsis poae (strain ATCC 64411 / 73-15) TaxID=644358 RepID=A0A0C4ECT3_MAGP6|nr:hypothetical protein MAPG_10518 [Magnaporthiopsis poae ATCC 64411]
MMCGRPASARPNPSAGFGVDPARITASYLAANWGKGIRISIENLWHVVLNHRFLPETYVGVGSLDLFKAEDVDYAARLARADNGVELQLYPGVSHGFDLAAPGIRLSRDMFANEVRFIRRF